MLSPGRERVLSAIVCREAQNSLIIGNQRTSKFDRGRDQKPIRRVAMFELVKTITAGSGTMAERCRLDTRPLEEPRDPCLDRKIQLDPPAVDEQRNFPDADSTQTNSYPVLPATVNSEHGLTSAGGRRCRARGRYACRASVSVTARFLTGFGVRLDTEGRRDQVNTLPNPDRPAVSLEQRERPGIMIQETPHGLGNRLGLVARVSGFRLPLQSGR